MEIRAVCRSIEESLECISGACETNATESLHVAEHGCADAITSALPSTAWIVTFLALALLIALFACMVTTCMYAKWRAILERGKVPTTPPPSPSSNPDKNHLELLRDITVNSTDLS
uniref:Uncharacterized protein n=1 Tax=Plectus sambesii TaxID=2011161 RepID=A0A914V8H5_9BILA